MDRRLGAVPTSERCLALDNKSLPIPTVQAVQSRIMLYTVLDQNPSLMTSIQFGKAPSVISDQSAQAKSEEASAEALLDAQAQAYFANCKGLADAGSSIEEERESWLR